MTDNSGSDSMVLLDEITFPSARGGKRTQVPVDVSVVRSLTSDDLPALRAGAPVGSSNSPLVSIRHSHHQLARLLAEGMEQGQVSLITGYSLSYISVIRKSPAFAELEAYYDIQRDQVFVDTLERMRSLGLSTIDELQERLASEPSKFSPRELMELAELCLVKPMVARATVNGSGGASATPAVNVAVTFVSAQPSGPAGPIIENGEH